MTRERSTENYGAQPFGCAPSTGNQRFAASGLLGLAAEEGGDIEIVGDGLVRNFANRFAFPDGLSDRFASRLHLRLTSFVMNDAGRRFGLLGGNRFGNFAAGLPGTRKKGRLFAR